MSEQEMCIYIYTGIVYKLIYICEGNHRSKNPQ